MSKRLSKTLAAELADTTLKIVNPQNRAITLSASLRKHGFTPTTANQLDPLDDRATLIAWLLATYSPRD